MNEPITFIGYKTVAVFCRPGGNPFDLTLDELTERVAGLKGADLPYEVSNWVLAEWPEA